MEYSIDIDTAKAREDHEFLTVELYRTLELREKAVDYLWSNEDWDVLMVVVTRTDRINHYLWNAYEDGGHRYHGAFLDYYERVDQLIGRIYQKYPDFPQREDSQKSFFVLSDDGFTGIRSEVYLNTWLEKNGFLRFARKPPNSFDDLAEGTKAFALDPSRIYVHRKGRYPRGEVEGSDVPKTRDDVRDALMDLEMNGDRVLRTVFRSDEIYQGPLLDQAPDLVCLSNHGFDLKGSIKKERVFGTTDLTGMHMQDDAFFYCDRDISCQTIFDVKDNILKSLS